MPLGPLDTIAAMCTKGRTKPHIFETGPSKAQLRFKTDAAKSGRRAAQLRKIINYKPKSVKTDTKARRIVPIIEALVEHLGHPKGLLCPIGHIGPVRRTITDSETQ